jgi:hypothetical protein
MHPDCPPPCLADDRLRSSPATGAELRDLFAMAALASRPADPSALRASDWAYQVADSMLSRRARSDGQLPADPVAALAHVCREMLRDVERREANLANSPSVPADSMALTWYRQTIARARAALTAVNA